MAKIDIIAQPFNNANLGDSLSAALSSNDYDEFSFAVAFARTSGVLRLSSAMKDFRLKGGKIHGFVGIDLEGTSYEALTELYDNCDTLHIVHLSGSQTFHPKVYYFRGASKSSLFVGSHNLTAGGLWTNIESSSKMILTHGNQNDKAIEKQAEDYFSLLRGNVPPLSWAINDVSEIDSLLKSGDVEKEAKIKLKRAKSSQSSKGKTTSSKASTPLPIFPYTSGVSTKLPAIPGKPGPTQAAGPSQAPLMSTAASITPSAQPSSGDIVWFQSGGMTGGSGHELDLSMKARVVAGDPVGTAYDFNGSQDRMKGGVTFFGVDPSQITSKPTVTIRYNHVDYDDNLIDYPQNGKRPNGSWRLHISGTDQAGNSITSAFPKNYLKHKVLVFTRITPSYYTLEVFPEDDLQDFIDGSSIVARNGVSSNARKFGLYS